MTWNLFVVPLGMPDIDLAHALGLVLTVKVFQMNGKLEFKNASPATFLGFALVGLSALAALIALAWSLM